MKALRIIAGVSVVLALMGVVMWAPVHADAADNHEMLELVNAHRLANGREPLCLNAQLNAAALRHSTDMDTNNHFDHTGTDGSEFWERIADAGYGGSARAENIAYGSTNPQTIFNLWVNSSGHNKNMLLSDVNEMGVARVGTYWTQVFGRRSGACEPDLDVNDVDVNTDDVITPADAVMVVNRLNTSNAAADVDGSGLVTSVDVDWVLSYIGQQVP